jgi:hypothetical protein
MDELEKSNPKRENGDEEKNKRFSTPLKTHTLVYSENKNLKARGGDHFSESK